MNRRNKAIRAWVEKHRSDLVPMLSSALEGAADKASDAFMLLLTIGFEAGRIFQRDNPHLPNDPRAYTEGEEFRLLVGPSRRIWDNPQGDDSPEPGDVVMETVRGESTRVSIVADNLLLETAAIFFATPKESSSDAAARFATSLLAL